MSDPSRRRPYGVSPRSSIAISSASGGRWPVSIIAAIDGLVEQPAVAGQHAEQVLAVVGVDDDRAALLEHREHAVALVLRSRRASAPRSGCGRPSSDMIRCVARAADRGDAFIVTLLLDHVQRPPAARNARALPGLAAWASPMARTRSAELAIAVPRAASTRSATAGPPRRVLVAAARRAVTRPEQLPGPMVARSKRIRRHCIVGQRPRCEP